MSVNRRNFLQGLGLGAALAAVSPTLLASHPRPSIGVVGCGVMGASIAYHLARAGADVTVLEKTRPAAGATKASFAWINASSSKSSHYAKLRMQSLLAWRALNEQLPLNVMWNGFLTWAKDASKLQHFEGFAGDELNTLYPIERISAERFRQLAPNVEPGSFSGALHAPLDGNVDPVHATRVFVKYAEMHGAKFVYPCNVTALRMNGERLSSVETDKGNFKFDRVVIAGGIDAPALVEDLGYNLPLLHEPGIIAHSKPLPKLVNPILLNIDDFLAVKQLPNGALVSHDSPSPPKHVSAHAEILKGRPQMPEAIKELHGNRILGKIGKLIPESKGVGLDKFYLAYRPEPEDTYPVTGFVPNAPDVYLAVMHSGVTLAAIMGQYVTREVFGGRPVNMLSPYRPDRFVS